MRHEPENIMKKPQSMTDEQLFSLKTGDVFIYPDKYVNDSTRVVNHNYKCRIMAVIIDDDATQGFTIKRYLKTKKRWVYEFFDVWKVLYRCELK